MNLWSSEALLEIIPERRTLLALHTQNSCPFPVFRKTLHRRLPIAHWCLTMRADIVPQTHDLVPLFQQMLVDIATKDHLLLHGDVGVEIYFQLARTFPATSQLHAEAALLR